MNKNIKYGLFVCILILLSTMAAAETTLQNTKIDYNQYREIIPGEAGIVYKLSITNLGTKSKTYEFVPNTDVVRGIGSYRTDPSYKITLKPNEQQTVYFYLAVERQVDSRIVIPLNILSGSESTTIDLVARPIGTFDAPRENSALVFIRAFRILFSAIIVLIIIFGIVLLFRRIRKKEGKSRKKTKDGADSEDEVQTYY